ncbi:hypothetical protein D9M69_691130 [compost metagenome]
MIGVNLVAVAFDNLHIPGRGHAAGLLVVGNLVRNEAIAVILNANFTLSGNNVHITIIDKLIRLQKHTSIRIALVICPQSILRLNLRRDNCN